MLWVTKTILPRTAASGAASSAATLSKPTTSASIPRGGVAPLLPSAVTTSGCGKGETISARSSPRTQTGISNGSTWTLAKPSSVSRRTAQARARASASVPGLALADLGGETFQDVPGHRVAGERGVAQGRGPVRDRLGESEGGKSEREQQELFHGAGLGRPARFANIECLAAAGRQRP